MSGVTGPEPRALEWGKNNVEILVLIGILLLVAGGCVCVVWASRGGPWWVRGVARLTLAAGESLRKSSRSSRRSGQNYADDGS
jgi:hypothetical protein